MASNLDERQQQLIQLCQKMQEQLVAEGTLSFAVLCEFLGVKFLQPAEASPRLQSIAESDKPGNDQLSPRSPRSKASEPRKLQTSVSSKNRRISAEEPVPEAPPPVILSVKDQSFEVVMNLVEARFEPVKAEADPEGDAAEGGKKSGGKQAGKKPDTPSKKNAKDKNSAKGIAIEEPPKPSLEDEARQLLPKGKDGKPPHPFSVQSLIK